MATQEIDNSKRAEEKRKIFLSSNVAAEFATNLEGHLDRQAKLAKKLKKSLRSIAKTLNSIGIFLPLSEAQKQSIKERGDDRTVVLIKILDKNDIKLEHGEFSHNVWLSQTGNIMLHAGTSLLSASELANPEEFIEPTDSEYLMLYPFILEGVGKKISESLPENT